MTHKKDDQKINNDQKQEEAQISGDFNDIEKDLEKEIEQLRSIEEKEHKVEHKIEHHKSELETLKSALARSQADYQNLLMRVERDKTEMTFFIASNLLTKILPFIDNLERLINNTPEDLQKNSLYEGLKSVYNALIKQLESMGVKAFESIGTESDHELHEVVSQASGKKGIIIQELEKGYKLQDKVIRYAKVVVGSGEEENKNE
ncbi:nucleotide exchange factor GrpE [Candidatus Gracilibacteria bacterium]|nr:nucleotide exchange factor GrpE [Candidatus Gracilibacteria bacterium]